MFVSRRGSAEWLRASFGALALSVLAACGSSGGDDNSGGEPEPTISRIEVTPAAQSAPAGSTQQFEATAVYSDNSSRDVTEEATWISTVTTVATVSNTVGSKGRANALTVGTTSISAALDGVNGTAAFTVTAARPTGLTVTPAGKSIAKGTTQQFQATATFTDSTSRDVTADVTWGTNNATIASISNTAPTKGLATGKAVGSARINAVYQDVAADVTLTVTAATVTSVSTTPAALSLSKTTTGQLTAMAMFSDGTTQDITAQATWSSDMPGIASVSDVADSKGLVTANNVGNAKVKALFQSFSDESAITVTPATLRSISVTPPSASVAKGLSQQYKATGVYNDDSTQDLTSLVTWASSNTTVATISNASGSKGLAKGVSEGTVTITAVDPDTKIEATATFTVTGAVMTEVTVEPARNTMPVGTTEGYKAFAYFTDDSFEDVTEAAAWTSADPAIADVSNATGDRGLVLAKSVGLVGISAAYEGFTGLGSLEVSEAALTSIEVTPANAKLAAGFDRQYKATGIYSDNSTHDITDTVTWNTSDTALATVSNAPDSIGVVTGVAAGAVNILASQGSVEGSTPLSVTGSTLTSISVTPSSANVPAGAMQQYMATGTFSDSTTQDLTAQVSWSSLDTAIATVSNDAGSEGKATAVATGSTTIRAARGSVTGDAAVNVTAATLSSISVTPDPATIHKGTSQQFTATGVYSDSTTQDITTQVTWSSANTAIATISNSDGSRGLAQGVAEGSTTIRAALSGVTGTASVTVDAAVLQSIAVSPANKSVAKGVSVQYAAIGTYSDNSTHDITTSVTWTSDNTAVATISNASGSQGLASTLDVGTANITAALNGLAGATSLTVTAKTLSSISVAPANQSIAKGANQQYTATGVYSDGSTENLTTSVTWASSSTSVATISNAAGSQGLASSAAAGETTISATFSGVTGNTKLTVTPALLKSITLSPTNPSIPAGYFRQLTATGSYSDGTSKDITADVSWSSFNSAVANVSNSAGTKGRVTGVAAGVTTITAALSGISGNTSVTVTAATLTSMAVTPDGASISSGGTLQYTATGTFSDTSTMDLTLQVTWASSNTLAATISQTGLATAGSLPGQTTISATRGSGAGSIGDSTTLTRSAF